MRCRRCGAPILLLRIVGAGALYAGSAAAEPESDEEAELRQLEEDLAAELGSSPAEGSGPEPVASAGPRPKLLPDISLVLTSGLFYASDVPTPRLDAHEPYHTRDGFRFQLQGLELAFQASVDPYVRADVYLEVALDGVEVEEASLTTLALPGNLKARAGMFPVRFGRFNTQHFLETQPFVDMPLVNRRFFGGDQLRGLGAELSWLTPLPWFVELSVSVSTAQNDVSLGLPIDETSGIEDFLFVVHLAQSFELTDDLTFNGGLSAAEAPNNTGGPEGTRDYRTGFYGGDVYLKWRDPSSVRFVSLALEYIVRRAQVPDGRLTEGGLYGQVDLRLHRNWEIGARFDWFGLPSDLSGQLAFTGDLLEWHRPAEATRGALSLSFYVSEFQRWRLQYGVDVLRGNEGRFPFTDPAFVARRDPVHEVFLQYQLVMGAHGGHPF